MASYPPPPPAPKANSGMIVLVVAIAAVAVLVLCGGAATALYVLGHRKSSGAQAAQTATPPESAPAPPSANGSAGGCAWTPATGANLKDVGTPPVAHPVTGTETMRIGTNLGTITVRIDVAKTPCTAASFGYLGSRHFFDNSPCHRLVASGIYVLQCGDPSGTGSGGPGYTFGDENLSGTTGGVYPRGTVAMANAGPGTNGSQFFLVFKDSPLQPDYTPFGTITGGLSVVDQVAAGGDDGAFGQSAGGGHPKIKITLMSITVS
jgi:peptidyl-prolyl cis-trans isomerase B (cyclophilin B)